MTYRFLALSILLASACAVPRTHTDFSLSRKGAGGEPTEFISSSDLRVAGLVSEGLSFASIGRLYNAEARLRQALYIEPNNDRIAFNLAIVLSQAGQSQGALEIMNRLVAKEPKNPAYMQALADALEASGDHEGAKAKLKEAFVIFKENNNFPRASLIARSIANIAFGVGNEQEALCYSYEALSLAPSGPQASAHLRVLVALNLFQEAIVLAPALGPLAMEPLGLHSLAMAKYATGDFKGALEAEESALGRIALAPELGIEMNTAWVLMKEQVPDTADVTAEAPAEEASAESEEKMVELREGAVQFYERASYELVTWPAALRRELVKKAAEWKTED